MAQEQLLAFIGLSIAVVVIPGPDMALVARNVLRHGRTAGYATSLGICTGVLGWAVAAVVGVSTILAASTVAFTALKLAGAAYLIYLGISTLRAPDVVLGGPDGERARLSWRRSWMQGFLSALLNPKLGVFFLTMLPQFIAPGDAPAVRALQLAVLFDLIGLAWLVAYCGLLGAVSSALARPRPQRALRLLTGTVLIGLGARLGVDRA